MRPRPARPIEPTRVPPPAKAPPRSSSSIGLIIVLLLAAAAFAAAYIFRDRIFGSDDYSGRAPSGSVRPADPAPLATAPQPAATAAPPPATTPDPPAAKESVPAATLRADDGGAGDPAAAKSPSGGNVAWVAANGDPVEAGAPVVKLFGFQKVEAKLAEARDRGRFYERKLEDARARGDDAAIALAQRKVDEKKSLGEAAQQDLQKYVITAPATGVVKLKVAKGSQVKPGDIVAEIAAAKPQPVLRATFDAGAGAARYRAGGSAVVAAKEAPDQQLAAVVEKVEGNQVTVKLVAAGSATASAGDEIVLLPPPSEK
jgi:biotin carboxyl carrier protein